MNEPTEMDIQIMEEKVIVNNKHRIHAWFSQAMQWGCLFLSIASEGYQHHNITPYIHIMIYHIPYLMHKHQGIKRFSCQGKIAYG